MSKGMWKLLIAHIRQSDFVEQSVQEHLEDVASLARGYGQEARFGALAEISGFLHDMGKFTIHFTDYLKDAVIDKKIAKEKIDHSTAGAKYLYERFYNGDLLQKLVVETAGMAILSHHSGMQNFVQPDLKPSDYIRRITNKTLPFYEEVVHNFENIAGNKEKVTVLVNEAKVEMECFLRRVKPLGSLHTYLALMQKLVFSCLIDADRTNTRNFEEDESFLPWNHQEIFEQGYASLMETVKSWRTSNHPINQLRNKMSDNCDVLAGDPSSIRTLSIPTGGGKTYASLRYALKHAVTHKKSRIIYIVPYTTILEQNAQEVRKILRQKETVLEHHANVIDDTSLDNSTDYYDDENHKKLQLSRDNWDHPIIFTTMVQFLDAFYQKGTRKSRRLHSLTNAVLIFDEVQSVPYQHQSLFSAAVNFLHAVGNSSILLCTATQPALHEIDPKLLLSENAEMVPDLDDVVKAFERVSITSKVEHEGWEIERIADFTQEQLEANDSVLLILNTKTVVRKLYQLLKDLEDTFVVHLSTSMCPAHRKEKLAQIKERLGQEKVVCISTQLIEAGVDISFEAVIRSLAGLDSIAQAAGRCNRNAEKETGSVYIIRAKDEKLSMLPEIRIGAEVTANYILDDPDFEGELLSPKAIQVYFSHFFAQAEREVQIAPVGLDYPLYELLKGTVALKQQPSTKSLSMFKTIEQNFEAIHSPTTAVIVPYEGGEDVIADLNENSYDIKQFNEAIKKAQQFSVNLYRHELQALSKEGLIQPLFDGSIYCLKLKAYDLSYGVTLDGEATFEPYSF
ncbi:CRISPR-associated helicase Cas3' [Sporosarcina aquimarina]|uniref:CRISPR-associated helicase Cas3' n=1 Tax=Sporosarcina aquimarina TaxID=114975 RepID=UPI002041017D|nr:CRISPR-associated helicase Cas3' [Sporosarcina aquimarina]